MSELEKTVGGSLDEERTVETVTFEIKTLQRQAAQMAISYAIQIGMRLAEAKKMVGHGNWGNYVKELGYSASTAQNLIRVYEEYGEDQLSLLGDPKSQTFGNLNYSKALALLAVPSDEREEFVENHDVEGMSTRELQALIRERDEARKAAEQAEVEQRLAQEAREKIAQDMAHANERMEGMARELEELKTRPRDVAVEKVTDQEAIDAAVQEAMESQSKELEAVKKKLEAAEKKAEKAEKTAAKAKEEVEKAGKGNGSALEEARREAENARREAEGLRKELRLADTAVAAFRAYFTQWQHVYGCMEAALKDMEKETADKLRAAVKAQITAWDEKSGEVDDR